MGRQHKNNSGSKTKIAATTMRASNVFHNMGGKGEQKKEAWLALTRSNAPNQDELEQILTSTPYQLVLTKKEWETLLQMGVVSGTARGRRRQPKGEGAEVPVGLSCIDGQHFLDNVHRTLKQYSGDVSWHGSVTNLKEQARKRRAMKEMELRTKAPYSTRPF